MYRHIFRSLFFLKILHDEQDSGPNPTWQTAAEGLHSCVSRMPWPSWPGFLTVAPRWGKQRGPGPFPSSESCRSGLRILFHYSLAKLWKCSADPKNAENVDERLLSAAQCCFFFFFFWKCFWCEAAAAKRTWFALAALPQWRGWEHPAQVGWSWWWWWTPLTVRAPLQSWSLFFWFWISRKCQVWCWIRLIETRCNYFNPSTDGLRLFEKTMCLINKGVLDRIFQTNELQQITNMWIRQLLEDIIP